MASQDIQRTLLNAAKILPDAPGVYLFRGPKKEMLYIGKATSLRDRVRSYFAKDIFVTRGPLISQMLERATTVDHYRTDSVLEALILEANLIKKYQPPHNVREKDDKSFNYVVITKEAYPRVLLVRGKDLAEKLPQIKIKYRFGPFPQGGQLKEAMKIVRKIFPFRDKCIPIDEVSDQTKARACFNAQIGLCPGVCYGKVTKTEYAQTIKHLKLFFEGKKKMLVRELEKEMHRYAEERKFEKAADTRSTIFALNHIQDIALIKRDFKSPEGFDESAAQIYRIEAYDIAHISGTDTVGVMTVVEDGESKKSDYRKFKIIGSKKGEVNDVKNLKEVLTRRLKHPEWPMPNLMVVDGGQAQMNAARDVLQEHTLNIDIAAVTKDERHKAREVVAEESIKIAHERSIILANSESHRFAVAFHRKRRKKRMGI